MALLGTTIRLKQLSLSSGESWIFLLGITHRWLSSDALCRSVTNPQGANYRKKPELSLGEEMSSIHCQEPNLVRRPAPQFFLAQTDPTPPLSPGVSLSPVLHFACLSKSHLEDSALPLALASV